MPAYKSAHPSVVQSLGLLVMHSPSGSYGHSSVVQVQSLGLQDWVCSPWDFYYLSLPHMHMPCGAVSGTSKFIWFVAPGTAPHAYEDKRQ